jgi:hypothetical protein
MDGYIKRQTLQDIADAIREKNGNSDIYKPSEMASAIRGIEGGGGEGFDFSGLYPKNFENEFNQRFKDGIEYAKEIAKTNLTTPKSFQGDLNLVFMPDINWVGDGGGDYAFAGCCNLMYFGENAKITLKQTSAFRYAFNYCSSLKNTPLIDMKFCYYADRPFLYAFGLEHVKLKNVAEGLNFANGKNIKKLEIENWKEGGCSVGISDLLLPSSIRYIIWHALNGENTLGFENEGAASRTLKLHATPYASWEEWKTTKPSVEDCEYLGVDETEITKYGELTWEDIALSIKLITIAK